MSTSHFRVEGKQAKMHHSSQALDLPSGSHWLPALLPVPVPVLRLLALSRCCAQVKMVTGDQKLIAIETCRRLGMGTDIMEGSELMTADAATLDLAAKVTEVDGFAGVYPEHKHRIVTALQSQGRLVGMTGVLALLHTLEGVTGIDADAWHLYSAIQESWMSAEMLESCLQVMA